MGCTSSKEDAVTKNSPKELANKQQDNEQSHKKETVDRFQPIPGFVIKTRNASTDEKLFVNVFHHHFLSTKTDNTEESYLFKDATHIQDKKGDICVAYSIVIATKVSQQCDENDFKQKLAIEILLFLKKCFPFVDFDPDMIKFPKIKKGYVSSIEGNEMDLSDIPFFSVHHDVFQGTAATSSTSATTASPVPSPSPSPVPSTAQETPSVAVIEEKKEKLEVVPEVEEEEPTVVLVGLLPSQSVTPPASPLPAPTTTASDHTTTFEKTEAATPDVVSIPTPTPEKMSTPSASAPVAVVEPIEEEKKATKMIKRQSSVVVLPGPPKMTGWLKKRGHVVMNWKTRYFVLNNGFLSYYVDALDRPPYGKNLKGGLCLAGFRDLHSIDRDLYDIAILKKGEAAGGRSASTADTHNTGRSFSIFRRTSMAPGASSPAPAEHEARIHLVFCNNLVEPKALQSLRQGLGGVVEEEESSKGAAKDSHPVELLIEAPSADEKQAWLAALDAHILYIETVSNLNQEEQMKQEEQSSLYGKDAVDNEDESYVYTIQSKDDFTVEDSNAVIDNTNSTVSPGK